MKKNQKFSTASRKFVRFCFARAKRACARDCRRRSFLPNGYDILHRYPIKSEKSLFFNFFQRKKIGVGKSDFVRFCFARAKRACACAAPPVELRSKWFVRDRRMDCGARLGVNQGEAEGVYDCTRPRLSPQICPQDCPRGAAAGRFLWGSCAFSTEKSRIDFKFWKTMLYYD